MRFFSRIRGVGERDHSGRGSDEARRDVAFGATTVGGHGLERDMHVERVKEVERAGQAGIGEIRIVSAVESRSRSLAFAFEFGARVPICLGSSPVIELAILLAVVNPLENGSSAPRDE